MEIPTRALLLALGTLGPQAPQAVVVPAPLPFILPGGPSHDSKDHLPLLLGETTPKAILAHRASFRENLAQVKVTEALRARWKAVRQPFTLVAVFGSWCGDSHRQLPHLLALQTDSNPFIEVHYLGVNRNKALEAGLWPKGCKPQSVDLVPTFYLFALGPGGRLKRVGSIEETPPKAGQTMSLALVEMVEAAGRAL